MKAFKGCEEVTRLIGQNDAPNKTEWIISLLSVVLMTTKKRGKILSDGVSVLPHCSCQDNSVEMSHFHRASAVIVTFVWPVVLS